MVIKDPLVTVSDIALVLGVTEQSVASRIYKEGQTINNIRRTALREHWTRKK